MNGGPNLGARAEGASTYGRTALPGPPLEGEGEGVRVAYPYPSFATALRA